MRTRDGWQAPDADEVLALAPLRAQLSEDLGQLLDDALSARQQVDTGGGQGDLARRAGDELPRVRPPAS